MKLPVIIVIIVCFIATAYNTAGFLNYHKQERMSIAEFIANCTGKKMKNTAEYNFCLFVTPFDCTSCSEYVMSKDFINDLIDISFKKNVPFSINYVVSGEYNDSEKLEYVAALKEDVSIFIDKKNKVKQFLIMKYDTYRTPFMLILGRTGETKYWQAIEPDPKYAYSRTREKLLRILEDIL